MTDTASTDATTDPADQVDDGKSFAIEVARIIADSRSEKVCVLDLRGLSSLADFFVIGTGTSDRQMHAVLDLIKKYAKGIERRPYNIADSSSASWILADYIDVVVHLFDSAHRDFYDLDNLWGDAERVDWQAS